MKIVHTVPTIDIKVSAGLGQSALETHRQLLVRGHDSIMLTMWPPHSSLSRTPGVVPLPWPGANPFFWGPRNRLEIEASIRQADVVHCHGLHTHLNWCASHACSKHGIPLVLHPHGTLNPWYRRRKRLAKWAVYHLWERSSYRHAWYWRALSEKEVEEIRFVEPAARTLIICNGVDISALKTTGEEDPRQFFPSANPNNRWLLYMGRIAKVKGVDRLLRAWQQLSDFHGQWQLLLAGPDSEGFTANCRELADCLPEKARPVWLGTVTGEQKEKLLSAADLFVLPSLAEGLPVAAIEAMAGRTAVALTDACNLAPALEAGAGWKLPDRESELPGAIATALSASDQERASRARVAQEWVGEHLSWNRVLHALLQGPT